MTKEKKPTNKDALEASIRGLRDGMSAETEITEEVAADGKVRISHRKVGQKQKVSAKLSSFNEFDEKEIVTKRGYRKAGSDDLYDPTQSPKSEANLNKVRLNARVSRSHRDLFNELAKNYPSQTKALEHAVRLLAEEHGHEIPDEVEVEVEPE